MTTQIQLGAIESTAVSSLQGPRITSVAVTDNTYTVTDDTAVDSTSGGYIKITGTGFVSGCIVTAGNITASSTTFISSTEVRAQLSAQAAGSYNLFVSNPDGSLSIRVLGINFSGIPSWTTAANQSFTSAAVSFQFAANSDSAIIYSVNAGSTLPGGLSISSNGLLSGTANGSSGTVYTFTLQATDTENQNTPRTFVVTLNFADPYFNLTTLLIHADGINAANNNTFIDSSTNAFTITKAGTPIQGTFSPFSKTGWSNYFNGTTDYLSVNVTTYPTVKLGSGDFTLECWVYITAHKNYNTIFDSRAVSTNATGLVLACNSSGQLYVYNNGYVLNSTSGSAATVITANAWHHIALVRSGAASGNLALYVDGARVAVSSAASSTNLSDAVCTIGYGSADANHYFTGYISNFRIIAGSAVYSGTTYTVPTTTLTAISNTKLLTCQSNQFVDNSTTLAAITLSGTPSVQSYSPLAPTTTYGSSGIGGSVYCTATTPDYLTIATTGARVDGLGLGTGAFTVETWVYITSAPNTWQAIFDINQYSGGILMRYQAAPDSLYILGTAYNWNPTTNVLLNSWNHIALSRNAGGVFRVFVNGASAVTGTNAGNLGATGFMAVNYALHAAGQNLTGYFSSVRVVKGTAVYDPTYSTLTVPTGPLTAVSGTTLLLNGTDAAIYDQTSKNNLLTAGSTQISTAQYKFGTGSMYFNGTTDYITTAGTNQLMAFGTGAFTIEHWVKFTATTAYINSISDNSHFTTTNNFLFMWNYAGAGRLSFWINNGVACSTTNAYNNNAWHHVAVTRTAAGAITIWVDGVADGTATNAAALGTGSLIIGNQAQMTRYWAGYIDEVRVTRGYARYTAAFTPTTSAFNDQ